MTELIDHDARHTAAQAMQAIEMHVKHCDEATVRQDKASEAMIKSIGRVHARIDKLMWSVLVGVVAIIVQIILSKAGLI